MSRKQTEQENNTGLQELERIELREPRMYKVILHNDDYTSMEFVVNILMTLFHKTLEQANELMLQVHKLGKAIVGVYTREVAETKVFQVENISRQNQFPLKASMEEV